MKKRYPITREDEKALQSQVRERRYELQELEFQVGSAIRRLPESQKELSRLLLNSADRDGKFEYGPYAGKITQITAYDFKRNKVVPIKYEVLQRSAESETFRSNGIGPSEINENQLYQDICMTI